MPVRDLDHDRARRADRARAGRRRARASAVAGHQSASAAARSAAGQWAAGGTASLAQLDLLARGEGRGIEIGVELLQRLERDAGLLGDARRRVAGLDRVRLGLLGRLLLLGRVLVAVAVAVAPAGVPELPPAGSRASWTTEYSTKAKAISAMGARNRAGLRRAIGPAILSEAPGLLAQALGLGAGGFGRRAARLRCALAIEREAVTRPPARPGANAGASAATSPPWAPMPGSRNGVAGISSRRRARCWGSVAPGDGADVGEAGAARLAELGDDAREPFPQAFAGRRARGRGRPPRPGWTCGRARTRPPRCARAVVDQRQRARRGRAAGWP